MRLIDADAYKERNAEIIDCEIDHHKYQDTLRELIDDSPTVDAAPKWIPCEERLPKEKEVVLITNSKGNVRCGQFRGTHGKYWFWKGNTLEMVEAWMPLPEPYKGERREDEIDRR